MIFEFQRLGLDPESFIPALDRFLSKLPAGHPYAVEVRNPAILGTRYHDVLKAHGAAHVYNHWSFMPSLAEQHKQMERFTAPFTVLRLLTPLKMSYDQAKRRANPYDKIVGELPEMRRDTVGLVRQAAVENRPAYVLVNNRAEGNAPLTIQAIADELEAQMPP